MKADNKNRRGWTRTRFVLGTLALGAVSCNPSLAQDAQPGGEVIDLPEFAVNAASDSG